MSDARERWIDFFNNGDAYVMSAADLKILGLAAASKQSGPGGGNWHNIWQYVPTGANPDPNGIIFVPNTDPAFCINGTDISNTLVAAAWKKTDGKISNTGWVGVSLSSPPTP